MLYLGLLQAALFLGTLAGLCQGARLGRDRRHAGAPCPRCVECTSWDRLGSGCASSAVTQEYIDYLVAAGSGYKICATGCYVRETSDGNNGIIVERGCVEDINGTDVTAVLPASLPVGAVFCLSGCSRICICGSDDCNQKSITDLAGTPTLPVIDACSSSPCENGGLCTTMRDGYVCSCRVGYIGENCQQTQDPCDSEPCQNNGRCQGQPTGSYVCDCVFGYSGLNCQVIEVRPCDSNPCRFGGTCREEEHCKKKQECAMADVSYVCDCTGVFTGVNCEIVSYPDPCLLKPCKNGGHCIRRLTGYECVCSDGFTGDHCAQSPRGDTLCYSCTSTSSPFGCNRNHVSEVTNVDKVECIRGCYITSDNSGNIIRGCVDGLYSDELPPILPGVGVCASVPKPNGVTCFCNSDLCNGKAMNDVVGSSTYIDLPDLHACASNPCQHGGQCSRDKSRGYMCNCASGYTGARCDVPLEEANACWECTSASDVDMCTEGPLVVPNTLTTKACPAACYVTRNKNGGYVRGCADVFADIPALMPGNIMCMTSPTVETCFCPGNLCNGESFEVLRKQDVDKRCLECDSADPYWGYLCISIETWMISDMLTAGLGWKSCDNGCYVREKRQGRGETAVERGCITDLHDPTLTHVTPAAIANGMTMCSTVANQKVCFCGANECNTAGIAALERQP